jgi:hypothetical protein
MRQGNEAGGEGLGFFALTCRLDQRTEQMPLARKHRTSSNPAGTMTL